MLSPGRCQGLEARVISLDEKLIRDWGMMSAERDFGGLAPHWSLLLLESMGSTE